MELGSTIKRLRKEQHLTARKVAISAGISFNALSAIEKNRSMPTKKTFYAICDAMGIPYWVVLMECVTIDDIPPEKQEVFKAIWRPIMDYLRGKEQPVFQEK